jgi:hypothetical protein
MLNVESDLIAAGKVLSDLTGGSLSALKSGLERFVSNRKLFFKDSEGTKSLDISDCANEWGS